MTSKKIKNLRKKLDMNTKQFGMQCGVSPRTVEDWEQGRRRPSLAAQKLMAVLNRTNNSKKLII
jgi:putative transcriptional regulator